MLYLGQGCTRLAPTSEAPETESNILVLGNRGDPPSHFDTMRTSSIALHHAAGALFGPGNLVMRNRDDMYFTSPYVARRWYSNLEFTEWVFILRRDVYWHDGTPLIPEDIKFWLDLAAFGAKAGDKVRAPAYYKGSLSIKSVEVIQPDQVKITLEVPNRFFPEVLADPRIKIDHPRHLMEERIKKGEVDLSPFDVGLVGLGPFKFNSYEAGSIIRVRRFDRYFESDPEGNNLPYLDGIDYIVTDDALSMDMAFRTGRLDGTARGFGHYITESRKQGYVKDLGDDVHLAQMEGGTFRLAFNVLKPGPWQDARVRRAIALWIDKKASIPVVLDGFGWTSPEVSPNNPVKDKNFVVWPKLDSGTLEENRVKARQLMKEAGFAGGFSMGYLCRAENGLPGGQFLKDQLAGLGINLQLQIVDEAEWNRGRVGLDYDSQSGALSVLPIPEGTEGVYGRFSLSPDTYAKHDDKNVDRLYRELKDALDYNRRIDVWYQLQKYLFLDQTYIIPIAEVTYIQAFRTYVKDLVIPPEDGHTFTDYATVKLEKRTG
jgi:peptide/nickel transport system substrate-binding protein